MSRTSCSGGQLVLGLKLMSGGTFYPGGTTPAQWSNRKTRSQTPPPEYLGGGVWERGYSR